jgi:hypothetical protein
MLKIQIKDPKSGFRMNMPIPYHFFINLFVRKSTIKLIVSNQTFSDNKQQAFVYSMIEGFDYTELRHVLHQIKSYPSLIFIDVEAADGTIVKILNT